MSDLAKAVIRAIAEGRWKGASLFQARAAGSCPEAGVEAGDLLVYARATPTPNQAVVWSGQDGGKRAGRIRRAGTVVAAGRQSQAPKVDGVIVATLRNLWKIGS